MVTFARRSLTEHGENEVLGRVDLKRSLVVIFPLVVFTKFVNQPIYLVDPSPRPEVELWVAGDHFVHVRRPGSRCGAVPQAAHRPSPARERRCRHVRQE